MNTKLTEIKAWYKAWLFSPYFAGDLHNNRLTPEVREVICDAVVNAQGHQIHYADILLAAAKEPLFRQYFPHVIFSKVAALREDIMANYKRTPIQYGYIEFAKSARQFLRVATYHALLKNRAIVELDDMIYAIQNPIDRVSHQICIGLTLHLKVVSKSSP